MKFGKISLQNSTATKVIETDANNILKGDRDISSSDSGNANDLLDRTGVQAEAANTAPKSHATSHEDGGADEISVAGLTGALGDAQTAIIHNNSRHSGTYIEAGGVTYENLDANSDIGQAASTVAAGDDNRFSTSPPVYAEIIGGDATVYSSATAVQVTNFTSNGLSTTGATPDHTNDHITINTAGDYRITISISVLQFDATPTVGSKIFSIKINNGAIGLGSTYFTLETLSCKRSVSLSILSDLAVNDTVELWFNPISEDTKLTAIILNVEKVN